MADCPAFYKKTNNETMFKMTINRVFAKVQCSSFIFRLIFVFVAEKSYSLFWENHS